MNIRLNSKLSPNERANCAVVALAYGLNITYDEAHALCKKNGRKTGSGFFLHGVFKVSLSKRSRQFMGRRIGYHTNQHITLERFAKLHPTGNYIIGINHHYCALVDGKVYNQHKLNVHVKYYYYISKPKTNDSTSGQQEVDDTNAIRTENESDQTSSDKLVSP